MEMNPTNPRNIRENLTQEDIATILTTTPKDAETNSPADSCISNLKTVNTEVTAEISKKPEPVHLSTEKLKRAKESPPVTLPLKLF